MRTALRSTSIGATPSSRKPTAILLGGLHVLIIKGTGVIALSVATSPLVMTVQTDYPVNVSSSSLISWSGNLIPTLVHDEALAEIMQPGPDAGVTLRLEGDGKVLMEKSAPR